VRHWHGSVNAVIRQLDECADDVLGIDGVSVRTTLDERSGCPRLVQRQLRVRAGVRWTLESGGSGELWFVARGHGSFADASGTRRLTPGTALLVPPGSHDLSSADDLEIIVVELPHDDAPSVTDATEAHLEEAPEERTGDRTFRVLIGARQGFTRATQFVGDIPPSRAPLHEHTYDEVVIVLAGHGAVHVDGATRELSPGTCLYLPPGTKHCLENNSDTTLRVLGVFCPGGSPAAKREHPT
jgi:mannose-6-phosphate isomerase-like protein (cupin superfamily)